MKAEMPDVNWTCWNCSFGNRPNRQRCQRCNELFFRELERRPAPKATDDEFTQWFLNGPDCFCGALCKPAECLAFGGCQAHSTPVAAQVVPELATRIARRLGVK